MTSHESYQLFSLVHGCDGCVQRSPTPIIRQLDIMRLSTHALIQLKLINRLIFISQIEDAIRCFFFFLNASGCTYVYVSVFSISL